MQDLFYIKKFKKKSNFLLSNLEMSQIDEMATHDGVPSIKLMENAGKQIAHICSQLIKENSFKKILILCGPGNNGGDGYFAGHYLKKNCKGIDIFSETPVSNLTGDAKKALKVFSQKIKTRLSADDINGYDMIIDAFFGAGLSRPLSKKISNIIKWIQQANKFVVAVDIPSGINGDTGEIIGSKCFEANETITFFNPKIGHKAFPGKKKCGKLHIVDIGLKPSHARNLTINVKHNDPKLWKSYFPKKTWSSHKHKHGHTLILTGEMPGAGVLASIAALRCGVGLISVICLPKYQTLFNLLAPSIIVHAEKTPMKSEHIKENSKYDSIVFGPGALPNKVTRDITKLILGLRKPTVLDAGAISAFKGHKDELLGNLHNKVVMTPHQGEFKSLFPEYQKSSSLEGSLLASKKSGTILLLKGANTVISEPGGMQILSTDPEAPHLATAGSGDILCGIIAALISQGMDCFKAASAASWLHAHAASSFGPGLISEDLLKQLPKTISEVIYEEK
tara:strand:+ start:6626 stop:8146 length:1521 start_codon:yes stop_codon:yes gene_type:complete